MRFKFSYRVFLFSLLILTAVLYRGLETFDDSARYISAMQQLQGKTPIYEEQSYTHAVIPMLINPATVYIGTGFGKVLGSEWRGLAALNMIFYIATVMVFYNLALLLFNHRRLTVYATILFATTYSLVRFGPGSYMADMGGWFFYIFGLYFATRFFYSQQDRDAVLTGIVSMIGLFFKEYGGIGILALLVYIALSPVPIRRKIYLVFISCSFFLINIAFHFWSYFEKGYLYFRRYITVRDDFASQQTVLRTIKVVGSLFSIGWPFALLGLIKPGDSIRGGNKVLFAFLPSSLIFLAYPAYDQRICFVAIPLLVFLATLGLSKIESRIALAGIFILYIAANFFMPDILIWFNLDAVLQIIRG